MKIRVTLETDVVPQMAEVLERVASKFESGTQAPITLRLPQPIFVTNVERVEEEASSDGD